MIEGLTIEFLSYCKVTLTKINNIEYFSTPIFRYTCKQLSICTSRYADDLTQVCTVVFDEFDAYVLLFPEF